MESRRRRIDTCGVTGMSPHGPVGSDARNDGREGTGAAEAAIETGEPITQLADLQLEPTSGFPGRLRKRIERRRLGAEVTRFAWAAPLTKATSLTGPSWASNSAITFCSTKSHSLAV